MAEIHNPISSDPVPSNPKMDDKKIADRINARHVKYIKHWWRGWQCFDIFFPVFHSISHLISSLPCSFFSSLFSAMLLLVVVRSFVWSYCWWWFLEMDEDEMSRTFYAFSHFVFFCVIFIFIFSAAPFFHFRTLALLQPLHVYIKTLKKWQNDIKFFLGETQTRKKKTLNKKFSSCSNRTEEIFIFHRLSVWTFCCCWWESEKSSTEKKRMNFCDKFYRSSESYQLSTEYLLWRNLAI